MTTTHRFVTAISQQIIQIHTHTQRMRFFSTLKHNKGNCASEKLLLPLNQCKPNKFCPQQLWLIEQWPSKSRIFPIHIYTVWSIECFSCRFSTIFRSADKREQQQARMAFDTVPHVQSPNSTFAHLHTENNKIEANRMQTENENEKSNQFNNDEPRNEFMTYG